MAAIIYFNVSKCELLNCFDKNNQQHLYFVELISSTSIMVFVTDSETNVGVIFDKNLNFHIHIYSCINMLYLSWFD